MHSSDPPAWLEAGLNHIWLPYTQMKTAPRPVAVSRVEGARLILADGRDLIDGVASWWTAVHGYQHPDLIAAAKTQLDRLPHVMLGGLAHEEPYRLAARLAAFAPGALNHAFFTESGSVAVEVAMKIAVQYWRNAFGEEKTKFIAFKGGYHGDTFATMSICDPEEGMHRLFSGALQEQLIIDLPTDDNKYQLLLAIMEQQSDIAAIVVEPLIQGAGGMRMHDAQTLKRLRKACDAHGALLIFDEIFTGFGRTGEMFAAEKAGVTPDLMTLGKALTGGVAPLAATIATDAVYDAFLSEDADKALMHGPTFTGHAVGCAVANASLNLFEREKRLEQVYSVEAMMANGLSCLREKSAIKDVRICGAVAAIELNHDFDIEASRARFIERGVFIRPLGRVIYLTPAYTIDRADLQRLMQATAEEVSFLEGDAP